MNTRQQLLANPEELKRLYLDERMTTRQIGKLYGCSKHPVIDAIKELGITRRTHTNGTKPTCEQLHQWVETDHLTLAEIASRTNAHYTGVRWWIKQCGIAWQDPDAWTQRNLQRGLIKPDREELEALYSQHLSLQNIADGLGVSREYVTLRFREYGLDTRAPGWSHKTFTCNDGHVVKSTYELRVDDWLYLHRLEHTYEYQLRELGGTGSADFLVDGVFIEVWGVMDSQSYKERQEVKRDWYANNGHQLISLNYWDFSGQANGRWERKLRTLLP